MVPIDKLAENAIPQELRVRGGTVEMIFSTRQLIALIVSVMMIAAAVVFSVWFTTYNLGLKVSTLDRSIAEQREMDRELGDKISALTKAIQELREVIAANTERIEANRRAIDRNMKDLDKLELRVK